MTDGKRAPGHGGDDPFVVGSAGANDAAAESGRIVEAFLAAVERLAGEARSKERAQRLRETARVVAARLRQREAEFEQLFRIAEKVNYGVALDETLDFVYDGMREVIPYNRIGFSLIDEERRTVVARWARSDREMKLGLGYEALLEGSTLNDILETRRPRILNDLEDYLKRKPASQSTRLIVAEGMRSSLTCPLIVQGRPVGFMFFSSVEPGTYSDAHVAFFQQIAGQLSAVVEKGRLYTELARKKEIIEEQNRVMTRDLEMARQVQRALIPQETPEVEGLEIAWRYDPAIQVGGDLLDVIALDAARTVFFVADVMGHGVSAALVVSVIKAVLQPAVEADGRPAAVLASLNRSLIGLLGFHFVTAACCVVDRAGRSAELALAGHAPPIHFHASTGRVTRSGEGGLPLGVQREAEYPSDGIALAPGDVLLFHTDGVVEAMDPQERQYGTARLVEQVRLGGGGGVSAMLDAVRDDVEKHLGGREPADDITLLAFRLVP